MVYRLLRGPYLDPDTGVLRNRQGITDAEELERIERQRASMAATWLLAELRPTRWDPALLRLLHQQLFGQLYDWAGQYRTVEISKGTSRFAAAQHIPAQIKTVLAELEQDRRTWTPGDQIVLDYLAHTYSAIHPFREGNG
ncbi:Fic/DOC family protein, partial [Actinomyces israelii]|uniref:Fic/DOC family protein n=1 Tax=Actinomyces israelii TaxID=1659 RepID=UPI0005BAFB15